MPPPEPAEDGCREGERLRMNERQHGAHAHAQAQRSGALGAEETGERGERERAERNAETRVPQDAVEGRDVRRDEERRCEPHGQRQAPREPEQCASGDARGEQPAEDGEHDRIVRERQQHLVDLRRQRAVADAEISVEAAVRELAGRVRVPGGGEDPRFVNQPRDIAWPEHHGHKREQHQRERERFCGAGYFHVGRLGSGSAGGSRKKITLSF